MKTKDLEQLVIESEEFDEKIIKENGALPIFTLFEKAMEDRNIQKSELIKMLNIERTYGYQLLNGTRTPTREWIIKICLAIGLGLEETQQALKAGYKNILYVRNVEDAKAIYAIEHKMNFESAVEFIWEEE